MIAAAAAQKRMAAAVTRKAVGSSGCTPNKSRRAIPSNAPAPRAPITRPPATANIILVVNAFTMSCRAAPTAMRMPISRLRPATE